MNNLRNYIMVGGLLAFFAWYGLSWAYTTQYKEPRDRLGAEIEKYRQGIENSKRGITAMQQVVAQNQLLYFRSLPRVPNDARSLYSFWLLELLKYCDVQGGDVNPDNPTQTATGGVNYRFHIRGTCSLDQLSRLLFEFYCAPFLHKITSMSVAAQEGKDDVAISLVVDAISIRPRFPNDPYPLMNQLPSGQYYRRLASIELPTYHVIEERNLLRAAKGGVDRADYAYLTAINEIDGEPEVWLSIRTDESVVKAKRGDAVRIGSFHAVLTEVFEEDVVFERGGTRWLVTLGDSLNKAFALPPETVPTEN